MSGPHDRLVRFTFDNPERAAAELRAVLPAFVVSRVDWTSLKLERGSVVDPALRETETDLLFSARLKDGRQVLFYVLLEHQSKVERWMALRLLSYVVRQLEHWRREHPDSTLMPMILPLVLYYGPEGTWTAPRRVEELFDVPEEERGLWLAVLPQFWYGLDDLTKQLESLVGAQRAEELMGTLAEELISTLGEKYFEKGRNEGLARGRAEDVLRILALRGVHVDSTARQRILSCTDLNTLTLWLDRAVQAHHISEVLEDLPQ